MPIYLLSRTACQKLLQLYFPQHFTMNHVYVGFWERFWITNYLKSLPSFCAPSKFVSYCYFKKIYIFCLIHGSLIATILFSVILITMEVSIFKVDTGNSLYLFPNLLLFHCFLVQNLWQVLKFLVRKHVLSNAYCKK